MLDNIWMGFAFFFCDVYFIGGSSQRKNKDILIFEFF